MKAFKAIKSAKTHPIMPSWLMSSIEATALVFCPILSDSHQLAQVAGRTSDLTRGGPVCWWDEGGVLSDTFLWPAEDPSEIGNGKHNTGMG